MLTLAPRRLPFREEKKRLVHSVLKNTTSDRDLATFRSNFPPHSGTSRALQMRRICRWLIRFNVAPSDLLMQRRTKQIQPTDLKMRAIGAVVREFRERAGHSQERLSGECGFDRTYISRVERGIINPTVGRLWQIADALETPLSQIAKRMELWIVNQERRPKKPS
jgi:DNA-binding XRE family transcriptional regulator